MAGTRDVAELTENHCFEIFGGSSSSSEIRSSTKTFPGKKAFL